MFSLYRSATLSFLSGYASKMTVFALTRAPVCPPTSRTQLKSDVDEHGRIRQCWQHTRRHRIESSLGLRIPLKGHPGS